MVLVLLQKTGGGCSSPRRVQQRVRHRWERQSNFSTHSTRASPVEMICQSRRQMGFHNEGSQEAEAVAA